MKFQGAALKRLSPLGSALAVALISFGHLTGLAQPTNIYVTGFEPPDFDAAFSLVGQGGWIGNNVNGSGLVTNFFAGEGQQAYVGFFPLTGTNDSLNVWHPLNFDPLAAGKPLVTFSVTMSIQDSTTNLYDCFRWSVYNTNNGGVRLFTLDFDNTTTNINYQLDDGVFVATSFVFEPGGLYDLVITMNFASNLWSARLNDTLIVDSKLMTTRGSPLNLGDVDAVWVYREAAPGDNFMVFDNYRITAEPLPVPFRLDALQSLPDGSFSLRLAGEPGRNYAIEASTNLSAWSSINTNNATNGTFNFVDPTATNSALRFYRARLVP